MKIRKKTSFMLLAASTAAVVGVAAVSFAAWTGSNNEFTASASTGSATLIGFNDAQPSLTLGTLVPVDQEGTYTGEKYVSVALPSYQVSGDYTITVSSETALHLYVTVGAQVTTQPTKAEVESTAEGNKWQPVASASFEFEQTGYAESIETTFISLVLVSDENAEMNTNYSITVTLANQ